MVELASAVIGDPHRGGAVLERQLRIFAGLDALDHDGHAGDRANAVERRPVQRGLKLLTAGITAAHRDIALNLLALAVAVRRGVGRDDERAEAGRARAAEDLTNPIQVAANVELEPRVSATRGSRTLFKRRL